MKNIHIISLLAFFALSSNVSAKNSVEYYISQSKKIGTEQNSVKFHDLNRGLIVKKNQDGEILSVSLQLVDGSKYKGELVVSGQNSLGFSFSELNDEEYSCIKLKNDKNSLIKCFVEHEWDTWVWTFEKVNVEDNLNLFSKARKRKNKSYTQEQISDM